MFPTYKYMEYEPNRFNLEFNNDEAFIEYLMLIFEDPQFTDEQLREFITDTVGEALIMYEQNGRTPETTPLTPYVTQVVKTYFQEFKDALKQ